MTAIVALTELQRRTLMALSGCGRPASAEEITDTLIALGATAASPRAAARTRTRLLDLAAHDAVAVSDAGGDPRFVITGHGRCLI